MTTDEPTQAEIEALSKKLAGNLPTRNEAHGLGMRLIFLLELTWQERNVLIAAMSSRPAPAAEVTGLETIQTLLDLLNPLHGSLDRQNYDDKVRAGFDAPPDAEYAVNVTAQQERDLTQAVMILEDRKRQSLTAPAAGVTGESVLISRELLQRTRDYIGSMPTLSPSGDDLFLEVVFIVEPIEKLLAAAPYPPASPPASVREAELIETVCKVRSEDAPCQRSGYATCWRCNKIARAILPLLNQQAPVIESYNGVQAAANRLNSFLRNYGMSMPSSLSNELLLISEMLSAPPATREKKE